MMGVVIHIPHAVTAIPASELPAFLVSAEELDAELIHMTDRYTDDLFGLQHELVSSVAFPWSRLLIDPERFRDDDQEPMATRGMGAVYTRTNEGRPLRNALAPKERERLLRAYYDPHHAAFEAAVAEALAHSNRCLIIDAHSFPSIALPCDLDQSLDRPEICIGTDAFHTPRYLEESVAEIMQDGFRTVAINRPYQGAIVPMRWHGADSRVNSLMIEINRSLYMDEATGEKLPGFDDVKATLRVRLERIIERWRQMSEHR